MIMKVMNEEYPTTSRDNRRIFSEGKSQEAQILIKSTFGWLGVLWVFLGSSLVLPWSLTRGGLGRCKGREILIKVLFWEKAPEYHSGAINKEKHLQGRCCGRRTQKCLGSQNMLKNAKRTQEFLPHAQADFERKNI